MDELIQLVNNVILVKYEKTVVPGRITSREMRELEQLVTSNLEVVDPRYARQIMELNANKKDSLNIALEILKSFRKEMLAGKQSIENDPRPLSEKQSELERIQKALNDINHLTYHYIKNP